MHIFFKGLILSFSLYTAIFWPWLAQASMTSTNYQIKFDSVGVGGTDTASSSSYRVRDSLEFIQGSGSSTSFRVDQGYRAGIYDPVVDFKVAAQSFGSQVAATAITSTSVEVTDATDFAAGEYIAVVQDEGLDQASAVGLITSVAGTTLNVDFFRYRIALPDIDGAGDYVYELTASTVPLGILSPSRALTAVVAWEVSADLPTGYSVYVREGEDLRTLSGSVIDDVADGEVTIGSEEYGGKSSDITLGSSTFNTQDTAFTSALSQVASRTSATLLARDFLTLKVAAASSTTNGAYGHALTFVFVGDY